MSAGCCVISRAGRCSGRTELSWQQYGHTVIWRVSRARIEAPISFTADTNVAGSRCAYDRIVMDRNGKEEHAGVWNADRSFID